MSLDTVQQIIKTIEQAKHILITTRVNPNGDAIGSALAFCLLLKKMGKKIDVVIDSHNRSKKNEYNFLPESHRISPEIKTSTDTIIEFDLGEDNIKGLTYKIEKGKLSIRLFSDKKTTNFAQPQIKQDGYPYDLIIVLDCADLESLGNVYDKHTEFFYHVPIINIDHQPDNEHFGEMNLVEMTAVSTTEILFNLIESWQKGVFDEGLCTCLLTGIIHESKSFQTHNITPKTLAIASELISLGAKRELIIEKLYYNKPLNTLQMWGRVLANLKTDPQTNTMWSVIRDLDFDETQTDENDLMSVVEEMLSQTPQAKIAFIVYQKDDDLKLVAHTHQNAIDLRDLLLPLNPYGTKHLIKAELHNSNPEDIVDSIRSLISERWPKEVEMPKF